MHRLFLIPLLFLAACSPNAEPAAGNGDNDGSEGTGSPPDTPLRPASAKPTALTGEWTIDDGRLLYTGTDDDRPTLVMECRTGQFTVRLPGVSPIASEERLSIGGGGDVEALVADAGADGTAVEARGPAPAPERLLAFLTAGPGASYGAAAIGPLAPVPEELAKDFAGRCR